MVVLAQLSTSAAFIGSATKGVKAEFVCCKKKAEFLLLIFFSKNIILISLRDLFRSSDLRD